MQDLHNKVKHLKKLQTLFKPGKNQQISGKELEQDIKAILDRESNPT